MSTFLARGRPLTSKTALGLTYERPEATETEIGRMLCLPHSEWMAAAPGLRHETLVYLIREINGRNDELFGALAGELSKRVARLASGCAQGFDQITTEDILWRVEKHIFDLVLAEIPFRQSEFLEIAFGQAVERHTNDAVDRHNASTWGRPGDVDTGPIDDDDEEIERPIEYVADDGPGAEAILLQLEDVAVRRKWYRKARRAVKDPRHLEAVTLFYCEGYPVESQDEDDLVHYFNATARQIRHWIDTAMKQ